MSQRVLLAAAQWECSEPLALADRWGHPWCYQLHAKDLDLTTCIVTNASRFNHQYFDAVTPRLDWLGVSIDSYSDGIEAEYGRGDGNPFALDRKGVPGIKTLAGGARRGVAIATMLTRRFQPRPR